MSASVICERQENHVPGHSGQRNDLAPVPIFTGLHRLFRTLGDAMLIIVQWVLAIAPVGIFALALGLGLRFGFDRQTVERADDAAYGLWRDGGVAGSRFDTGMAEHDLNGACVGTAFQQVRGEAVT